MEPVGVSLLRKPKEDTNNATRWRPVRDGFSEAGFFVKIYTFRRTRLTREMYFRFLKEIHLIFNVINFAQYAAQCSAVNIINNNAKCFQLFVLAKSRFHHVDSRCDGWLGY